MNIAERVAALIEDGDYQVQEIADAVGVNRKQVQRWQKGDAEMGIYKLKELCNLYKVSADYILGLPKGLNWPRIEE